MAVALFGRAAPLSIAAQLAQASPDRLVTLSGVGEVAVARWRSRCFVEDALFASKGSRGRSSWINNEGFFVREIVGPEDHIG